MQKQNTQTILTYPHQHNYIYQTLLQNAGSSSLFGVKLISWSTLENKGLEFSKSSLEEFHQIFQLLQQKKEAVPHFQEMLQYPSFVQELIQRYQEFVRYEVKIEDLPNEQPTEKEIKYLLSLIDSLPLNIHKQVENIQQLQPEAFTFVLPYTQSLYEKRHIEQWIQAGGKSIVLPQIKQPNVTLYKAQNMRQEVESVAQWIIQHQQTLPLEQLQIVIMQNEYLPYLEQVFHRYEIPVDFQLFTKPSLMVQKLLALLSFIETPTIQRLIRLFHQNYWLFPTADLAKYLGDYPLDPKDLLQPLTYLQSQTPTIIDQRDLEPLQKLEQRAERQRQQILPLLERIFVSSSTSEQIVIGFQHLLQDPLLSEKEEAIAFQKAKDRLQTALTLSMPLSIIQSQLTTIEKNYPEVSTSAVMITTLQKLIPNFKQTIVMGCSQNNFPNIPTYSGAIDETYLSKVPQFPSKEERVQHYYQQAELLYHISPEIIFSYSCGNLQGKSFEWSIEIEQRYGKAAQIWPLKQIDTYHHYSHSIVPELALPLFMPQQVLKGSVSSFERYQNCQYAYFLERGLRIYPQNEFAIDHRILGTLQHAIVEHFIAQQKPVTQDEITTFVKPLFQQVIDVLPHQKHYIEILQKQMCTRMFTRLEYLHQLNEHSLMKPVAFEQPVQMTLSTTPVPIELKGIIDRIDASQEYFRIIDYKSSSKELSDVKFNAGLQLQLLTYLYIAEQLYDKRPFGVYYVSLQTKNTNDAIYGPKDKETKEYPPMNAKMQYNDYLKSNCASGWQMEDSFDDELKQPIYFKAKEKDWDALKQQLLDIYHQLAASIYEGQIQTNPTENTCQYCPFLSICRYHGEPRKISDLASKGEE